MVWSRQQRQRARSGFRSCAGVASRAGPTRCRIEGDADGNVADGLFELGPPNARLALRAARRLVLPIDGEGSDVIAFAGMVQPAGVRAGRANQVGPMLVPARHQQTGLDIAAVYKVPVGEQL